MSSSSALIVAVEGVSGSGKSTFSAALERALQQAGLRTLRIGGMQEANPENPISEFIRTELLSSDRFMRRPLWSETFLMLASLAQNSDLIAKSDTDIVLRENYVTALRAFQASRAAECGLGPEQRKSVRSVLRTLAALAPGGQPDITYWVQTPEEGLAQRLSSRSRDAHLDYGVREQALQLAVEDEYGTLLRDRPRVVTVGNEDDVVALDRVAAGEVERLADSLARKRRVKGRVYVAGPLFDPGERSYLEHLDGLIASDSWSTYLPHRDGGLAVHSMNESTRSFFESDAQALADCDAVVAVLAGPDVDSGTAWEVGYAFALGRPVVGLYEDTRLCDLNLMVGNSVAVCTSTDEMLRALGAVTH